MISLWVERYYPYAVGLLGVIIWGWGFSAPTPSDVSPILGASVTVSAVLGGFLGASKTIVLSIRSSRLYYRLKNSGYLNDLFRYMTEAIVSALLLLAASLFGFFVNMHAVLGSNIEAEEAYFAIWIVLVICAVLNYYRIYRIMTNLLRMQDSQPDQT